MENVYYALQYKSKITGEWVVVERWNISNYKNSQIALNLAIIEYEDEEDYDESEKRIVKGTEEVVYGIQNR